MSLHPNEVLLAPVVSEKSYSLLDDGKYTFEVDPRANKTEIKLAIEKIFNVKVDSVRVLRTTSKIKKVGRSIGRTSEGRKAYVKLKAGEKLPPIFEGV